MEDNNSGNIPPVNSVNIKEFGHSSRSLISFMEHSEELWGMKDEQSRHVFVNKRALSFYNVRKGFDVEGKLDREIPMPSQDFWQDMQAHDQMVMRAQRQVSTIEINYFGQGNTDRPVPNLCEKAPLYDEENRCLGIVWHSKPLDAPALLYYMHRFNRPFIEFDTPNDLFSKKELEIVFWALQRLSSKEIARRLSLSHRTVENRLGVIYQKAGVNSLLQLIEYGKATGLDRYIPANFIRRGIQLVE